MAKERKTNGEKNSKPAQFEAGKIERTTSLLKKKEVEEDEQQHFKNKFSLYNNIYI